MRKARLFLDQDALTTAGDAAQGQLETGAAPGNEHLASVHGQAAHLGASAEHVELDRQGGTFGPEQRGYRRQLVAQFSRSRAGHEQTELVAERQRLERRRAPGRLQQAGEGDLSVFATGLTTIQLGVEHVAPIFVTRLGGAKFWWDACRRLLMLQPRLDMPDSLRPLLEGKQIVVCVGAGGVGKTTIAATIALGFAKQGERVLCITIDPAKRLADSLGIGAMSAEEQLVSPELFTNAGLEIPGQLTVLMLDTKRTFDDLVRRHASSPAVRERILQNRIYSYVSTSLAGTQSYMAMEKVLLVRQDPRFDRIVLDTPPTSNALDFLDAPERLIEAIDSAAMRWLVQTFEKSGRFSLNFVARGVALVLRGIGRLTGKGFLEHLAEFVVELNELFGGFRERAAAVAKAFRAPDLAYVLVTSAAPAAIDEVSYFAARLRGQGMRPDAVVVNRLQPNPPPAPLSEVIGAARELGLELSEQALAGVQQAAEDDRARARFEAEQLQLLDSLLGAQPPAILHVPVLSADVHDVRSLSLVSARLFP